MGRPQSPMREQGRKALEQGLKRFIPDIEYRCVKHGSDTNEHYSISGRCCLCDTKQKNPEKQALYWKKYKARKNLAP